MFMLVNCSRCRTPLQLPPGAPSIRCAICQAVTHIGDPRHAPPPPAPGPPAPPSPYSHAPPAPPPNPHGQEETDPYRIPTKQNMRMALYWLVQGCQPGDSLVFHYSGHGSRQRNYNGDEVDGYDETLCPLDFETQGMIVDDEINASIVRPLPHGVKLHAVIDACHSGTVLDLPFLCRMNRSGHYVWEDHRPRSGVWKGSNGGEVISFSGCDDDQTSADTSRLNCNAYSNSRCGSSGPDLGGGVTSLLNMLLTGGSVAALAALDRSRS
ncbi:hypothetical protein DH2020_046940 [Rehmannia glutinosa]|uniref:Metacaspase-1-like n=1 Tax=Rehmannia glutinosa TaxID=99300 RepID=A0ABR0UBH7_REHGL